MRIWRVLRLLVNWDGPWHSNLTLLAFRICPLKDPKLEHSFIFIVLFESMGSFYALILSRHIKSLFMIVGLALPRFCLILDQKHFFSLQKTCTWVLILIFPGPWHKCQMQGKTQNLRSTTTAVATTRSTISYWKINNRTTIWKRKSLKSKR